MKGPESRTFKWRRGLIVIGGVLALGLTAALGYVLHQFRDRNPGYTLDLKADGLEAFQAGQPLKAGFGRSNITPDISDPNRPVWLAGFSQNRRATAVHDDLWATACVFDDGFKRVGIVSLDAIGLFHDDVVEVRRRIPAAWKVDYAIVCSTHNHSTPDLMGLWGPHPLKSGVDPDYREQVIRGSLDALGAAVNSLQAVEVSVHALSMPTKGLVADTRRPEVFDADLRVLHCRDLATRTTVGTLVSWGNHPETVWGDNTEVTSDFCGYLRDELARGVEMEGKMMEEGVGGLHVFVNGAVGGLMTTHPGTTVRDPYLQRDFLEPSHEKARAVGRQLVSRILPVLRLDQGLIGTGLSMPMAVRARTVELPLANRMFTLATGLGLLDRGQPRWNMLRTEVAMLSLGDVTFACVPGEIYPEIVNGGIENPAGADYAVAPVEVPPLRDMMRGNVKFILGLANDEIGYIIPKSEWDSEPPHLYGSPRRVYGEVNSVGPETAPLLHEAFKGLALQLVPVEVLYDSRKPEALTSGWTVLRDHPDARRFAGSALVIRVEPGNMWGGENSARNVFVRELPDPREGGVELSATVSNRPTSQYEQVNLVWYYDDSHMVKLGHELVDGAVCIVMGREEGDRTRTVAKLPYSGDIVHLRLFAEGDQISGQYRSPTELIWREAGRCSLPSAGRPHLSLQCYQGPLEIDRWVSIRDVQVRQLRRRTSH